MIDVDGNVIATSELLSRVEALLRASDAKVAGRPRPDSQAENIRDLDGLRSNVAGLFPIRLGWQKSVLGFTKGLAKRLIIKMLWWYIEPRWAVQQDFDSKSVESVSDLTRRAESMTRDLEDLRRQNGRLRLQMLAGSERASQLRRDIEDLGRSEELGVVEQLNDIEAALRDAASQDEVDLLRSEVAGVLERVGAASASGANINYVEFEDRFRGDSRGLRSDQERYVDLFPGVDVPGRILDVGCGRGEMVELLLEKGQDVLGVDTDRGMVEVCTSRGLPAVVGNGLEMLAGMEDGSLKGVFCAQVVEHLLTSELERFIRLAQQKLRSGGVLVVETINPRSSFALGNHFYADTSHVRPVHPETLRFICEQVGFEAVDLEERSPHPVLELMGRMPEDAQGQAVRALVESVFGYQDYVIVATR